MSKELYVAKLSSFHTEIKWNYALCTEKVRGMGIKPFAVIFIPWLKPGAMDGILNIRNNYCESSITGVLLFLS